VQAAVFQRALAANYGIALTPRELRVLATRYGGAPAAALSPALSLHAVEQPLLINFVGLGRDLDARE